MSYKPVCKNKFNLMVVGDTHPDKTHIQKFYELIKECKYIDQSSATVSITKPTAIFLEYFFGSDVIDRTLYPNITADDKYRSGGGNLCDLLLKPVGHSVASVNDINNYGFNRNFALEGKPNSGEPIEEIALIQLKEFNKDLLSINPDLKKDNIPLDLQ